MTTLEILKKAKAVSLNAALPTDIKNNALTAMAKALVEATDDILAANAVDMQNAKGKISDTMLDRLMLNADRIKAMAKGIEDVRDLPDNVGKILSSHTLKNGLVVNKVAVPIGVVAIIYESRPNVTSDAAALAFKSGNVCVLRGGKEAFNSAKAIVTALKKGLEECGINSDYVNLVEDTTRQSANELMTARGLVDVLIPRGGKGLIQACVENAKVPCIETGTGICHIFVEKTANVDMALNIVNNAKTSRPSVCNAAEVLLVDKAIADEFLPKLYEMFNGRVELVGCEETCSIISVKAAGEDDFDTEFLDYKMAIKIVDGVMEAVNHISAHSTHHSESIITSDDNAAQIFTACVDSAAVYVNASTRFTDGGEFGLGCEMGISTQKIHARGPMGLEELNTYKYIIKGNGQVR
ncbi:MAG: glutamate-5-semialdehyde dehydrogenase [Clostridia bacterium]|nr:glutamate-5-semialdehyde dehydrogenase [Clostridia bacterium]